MIFGMEVATNEGVSERKLVKDWLATPCPKVISGGRERGDGKKQHC